jgi:ribosomal protein S18 acetylase RimI-like enzyme
MITIERVRPASVHRALPLLAAQFDEHAIALSHDALASAVHAMVSDERIGVVIVAVEGDRDVGVCAAPLTFTLEVGGLAGWIDELYVVPDARGRGIGTQLLDAATALLRERGARAVDLEVDRDHTRACALYERAGFVHLGRERMQKRLIPA